MTSPTQPLDLERMREMAPITDELIRYIARFGGMCRECADNHGVCPNSGLPCDDVDKAIRSVLTALNYGTSRGFVPSPLLDALSSERAARLAAEAQVSALQAQVDGLRDVGVLQEALERAWKDCGAMAPHPSPAAINIIGRHMAHHIPEVVREFSQPPADEAAKGEG